MSADKLQREISHEQAAVDRAYQVLDSTKALYRERQRQVASTGAWGSHQARTERDAISSHYGDEAARLEQVDDRLVFGRITKTNHDTHYIGRVGLVDEHDNRVLLDWRAPAALPFYQATAVEPLGVSMRRHISTKQRTVVGLEDELLDASAVGEINNLQGEGALLAALSDARDSYMSDIVATIQAEQDRVIRSDDSGIVVVQGGPGTGKTAVALHRAAYLLYSQHKRLARSGVLIVGPSPVFLRYIEKVLPSLGETGVVSLTPGQLVPGVIVGAEEEIPLARLKGDPRWAASLLKAVKQLQRIPKQPVELTVTHRRLTITPEMVREAQTKARRTSRHHNEGWSTFASEIMSALADQLLSDQEEYTPEQKSWALADIRSSDEARKAINLLWLPATEQQLLSRLFADSQRLAKAASWLTSSEVEQLTRPLGSAWTEADVALLDEAAELLGEHPMVTRQNERRKAGREQTLEQAEAVIQSGIDQSGIVTAEVLAQHYDHEERASLNSLAVADRTWTYGHVVVDEAQELSPMMWRALLRRCPARSFTVVGDLDQQRVDHQQRTWAEVLGPAAQFLSSEVVLTTSYRTPATITEAAERVMTEYGRSVLYPVSAVRDVPDCLHFYEVTPRSELAKKTAQVLDECRERLNAEVGSDAGRIAVIVPRPEDIKMVIESWGKTDSRVIITTAKETKGLEFDSVVLVDPTSIATASTGDLYVSMTRPTRELFIIEIDRELKGLRAL
ncbi:HelD family protein [Boudabousia marimammalium]|uniref:Uncharacterized protein n=1 Tax=Boudabousia marimammalium TaxID=156892 RepID=A0A1Q5PNW6_9ACTO|nr:hypothetical protein [Boudabousia marimammalium]OKL49253.1 hypothetical protein BM477_04500 [Boudabousia marimammalium]